MIDIDELIQTWQQRLQAITVNANELSDAESTKRIRIRVRDGSYRGMTHQRAQQAMDQLTSLVDDYLLLARMVDQAAQANEVGLFGSREQANARILALLQGPSIERAMHNVPLAQRALLGSATQQSHLTPEQLLTRMQQDFAQARDSFAAIDRAETQGAAQFTTLRQDFARLQQRATQLHPGADNPPLIELQDFQADPLNAEVGMASMRRSLKAWAENLYAIEQSAASAQAAVAVLHGTLQELRRLDGELQGLRTDLRPLLGESHLAAPEPTKASRLDMLAVWFETLSTSLQAGQWAAVLVGANRLQAALAEATGDVHRVLTQLQGQRDTLDDLNGQFTALQVKERTLRARGTTTPELQTVRDQIAAALQQRPPQPDAIGALLKHYRELLSGSLRF